MATESIAVLGPLGSGKTSTLNQLLPHVPYGESYAVIVNDVGTQNIDARRIEDHPANRSERIIALTSGCIGCSDVTQFHEAVRRVEEAGIDILFIEPTGIAPGNEIMQVLKEGGRKTAALTLVNARTVERDLRWQVLPSQLEEAQVVGITHAEEPKTDLEIITHALEVMPPLKPETAIKVLRRDTVDAQLLAQLRGLSKEYSLGGKVLSLVSKDHHAHDHSHSNGHNHGVIAQSLQLKDRVDIAQLKQRLLELAGNETRPLLRAKGVVSNQRFDVVGDDWNSEITEEKGAYMNIIFGGDSLPANISVLDDFIDIPTINITSDKKAIVKSINNALSKVEREERISEFVQYYPKPISPIHKELIIDCEADEAYELAFWGGVDDIDTEYKEKAMQAYIGFRLDGFHEFSEHPGHISRYEEMKGYWARRFGATLGYNYYHLSDYMKPEQVAQIRIINPAKLLAEGFLKIDELTFDEGRAEEKPEFLASVLVAALADGDIPIELARKVFDHGMELSLNNNEFYQRFSKSALQLIPTL